jgi:chromosomal replication initiator protein
VNNSSTTLDLGKLWLQICHELRLVVSPDAVTRWFGPLRIENLTETTLVLRADNSIYQYWIEENYLPQLKSVVTRLLETPLQIQFAACEDLPLPKKPAGELLAPAKSKPAGDQKYGLNPRHTFDSFVVGVNNELASAAAQAVAQAPSRTYNPLFLHGSVGLGKTHLMQAIGQLILQRKKHLRVMYVTSEQFTNEFIGAIQHGELAKFRKSYRQVDVLLIDDIQFLGGKERSQEEFFHTFNSLYDNNKQIVMTSDAAPGEISNLEKRLVSRFEWGLTASLQPPDQETRLAILRQKMEQMPEKLGNEILEFIATRVKTNVRRLEGALTRVAAYAALHGKNLTVPQVEVLLKDLLQQETRKAVSIDLIQRKVAETYDIRLADMTSKRRPATIALPRMVAMYLSRKLTTASLNEIGEAFGGRDHGTVLHANRTLEEKIRGDEKLRQVVGYLSEKLSDKE